MTETILMIVPAAMLSWAWLRTRERLSMVLMWRGRAIADELFWLGQDNPELRKDRTYQWLLYQARVLGTSLVDATMWNVLRPGALETARRISKGGQTPAVWEAELEKRPQLLAYDRKLGRLSTYALLARHLWLAPLYVAFAVLLYFVAAPIIALLLLLAVGLDAASDLLRLTRTVRSSRAFAAAIAAAR